MEKFDIHLHILPEAGTVGRMTFESPETMVPYLRTFGIERGVLMSTGKISNAQNKRIADRYPGMFRWMCNVDASDDPEEYFDILSRCKREGAVGVGELMLNSWIDSPNIQEIFRCAEELQLPVLFHMSPAAGIGYGIADRPRLPLLESALKKYPTLIFIGHSQPFWIEISADAPDDAELRNQWGSGTVVPPGRIEILLDSYENLYCDLSANSGGMAILRDEKFGLRFLEKYQDRLLFGTDLTNSKMVYPLSGWLDRKAAENRLSLTVYRKICRRNAERIFGIE